MEKRKAITLTDETKRTIEKACESATLEAGIKFNVEYQPEWVFVRCKDGDDTKLLAVVSLVHRSQDEVLAELFSMVLVDVAKG